jgi:hypothetical protein
MARSSSSSSWLARRVESALAGGFAQAWRSVQVEPERFLVELQAEYGLPVRSFSEMALLPVERVDAIAERTIRTAIRLAALEGAGFGAFGIFALVPDTAVLAAISVQMLQKLSLIYGFEFSTERERAELWLAAASAVGLDLSKDWLEREVLERFVPRIIIKVSERLGIELAERAAAKVVPILSSALGGALNYWFVRRWGKRIQRHFREKHLAARGASLTMETRSSLPVAQRYLVEPN